MNKKQQKALRRRKREAIELYKWRCDPNRRVRLSKQVSAFLTAMGEFRVRNNVPGEVRGEINFMSGLVTIEVVEK